MATVHTEYGPGQIIDRETVRGRTRCKVAGEGFEVWIDQAKLGGLDEALDGGDSYGGHPDLHDLRDRLRVGDEYDDDDPARYSNRRLAWAPFDGDNSTELPYNPEPQHHTIGTPGDDGSSTIQPIHHIDADERLRPSDSVSFDAADGDYGDGPGPDPDLFAREGALTRQALVEQVMMNNLLTKYGPKLRPVLHKMFGPVKGEALLQGAAGHSQGAAIGGVDAGISEAVDWAAPGGSGGGYGNMIHNSSVREATPAALLPILLRTLGPSAVSGLMGGGEGGEGTDVGPGEGYGDMIQASRRPAGLDDRYIDLTASADYHSDPAAQFRHDPDAYINRVGHLLDEGLNPRFAEYMELVEGDSSIRTAAWKDVRKKAMRLKTSGAVHVKDIAPSRIMASVDGDHGTYDVTILKGASIGGLTGSSISNWHCSCEWGRWAFRRKHTFVGRLCSHAYASYLTMQSAAMKGQPRRPKRGPADTVIVKRPGREQYLPTFTFAAGQRTADNLQNGPERLTPDMVVNDTDDAHIFLDVTKDEREDVGPDDVVSQKDIAHFARLMRHCEANEQPYPRQLVAFLARYAGCSDDSGDDTPSDYEAPDVRSAEPYLEEIRSDGDRKQEQDFGSMADRVHKIQDAVEEARAHGTDADRFVAAVQRMADLGDYPYNPEHQGYGKNIGDFAQRVKNTVQGDGWKKDNEVSDGDYYQNTYPGKDQSVQGPGIGKNNDGVRGNAPGEIGYTGPGSNPSPPSNPGQTPKAPAVSGPSGAPAVSGPSGAPAVSGPSSAPAVGGGSGKYTAPGGGQTSGDVVDGGVAGAENSNNSAITKDMLDADGYYTMQQGDTLTDVAQRGYGDMNKYQDIAKNNTNITNVDDVAAGTKIKLDGLNDVGNGGVNGDVTNPAGGGSDNNISTPEVKTDAAADPGGSTPEPPAGAAEVNAVPPVQAPEVPATPKPTPAPTAGSTATGALRTARDWLRWAGAGHDHSGEASPSATDQAAGAGTADATTSPGAAPATNPATDPVEDAYDPTDPAQAAEQQQSQPGQQPATGLGMGMGMGTSSGGGMGGGMDMGGVGDMIGQGVGIASDFASGVGQAMPGIADAIGGIASGIGSIFSSKQDAEDWRRYAYPADGGDDFDPETLPHIPFAGSGNPGPLEFSTSEEYADEARRGMEDVTDLADDPLSISMEKWQKQGSYDEDDDGPYREASYDGHATDDSSDIVRTFQAHLGDSALGQGAGGGGRFDDIAGAAAGFLRTAGRNYSLAEQSELIREGDKGGARNLDSLDLSGTHYEDMTTLGW